MGLFDGMGDGGFDMDALLKMLNPIGGAEAATLPPASPDFNDRFSAARPGQGAPYEPPVGVAPPPTDGLPQPTPPNPIVTLNPGATPPVPPTTIPGSPTIPVASPTPPPSLDSLRADADVGAALSGKPSSGSSEATDISAKAKTPEEQTKQLNTLAQALKGVQAPAAPVFQKLSSPSVARPTGQIKGGELQALLMALNAGAPNLTRQLPTTLGKG